ncbi:MAG TPA: MBL fold metallo-hydrolase [Polyangiaceae bacterium]|jgi:glyoxylase-like metal-dependent hydrolase (beta-lactamase superfamily II)|nr:MBL fold metallo-hydrolase [Polyangiaceae bacterium]
MATLTPPAVPTLIRHPHGITTVDAQYVRPHFASVHILEREGHAAIIDTGANAAVPLTLAALEQLGIPRQSVELLFLTHVHLDHAGGAGLLLQELPNATVSVHPRGAAHLVDPSRLEAATIAVYGQRAYEQLYGKLVPIAAERIAASSDGGRLQLGSSELTVLHTPGHALHHHALFDAGGRAVFTGDTFGLSYRELDTEQGAFIVPTTTPTQFDPEQLLASVARLAALPVEAAYLTHFGRVTGVPRLGQALREQIEACVAMARRHASSDQRHSLIRTDLRQLWIERARAHGLTHAAGRVDEILGPDLELNVQGLLAWLDREQRQRSEH